MSFTPNIPGHRVYGNIDLSGGTISAGSLSATTIYSGGTPLTEIFATTGTTFVQPTQVVFGSSTSGLTSSSRFIYAPTTTANKFEFRDWVGISDYPTIYMLESGTTASNSNYTLASDGGINTYLNAPIGGINLNVGGSNVALIGSGGSSFVSPLTVSNSFRANSVSATTLSATTARFGDTMHRYNVGGGYTDTIEMPSFGRLYSNGNLYLYGGANLFLDGSSSITLASSDKVIITPNSELLVNGVTRTTSLSATTLSASTLYSGATNLSTTIISIANAAASAVDTAVQAGSNITTGGTANAPTINVSSSPSLNALTLSGAGQFASVTSTGLSATTVSATTLFSGNTELGSIFNSYFPSIPPNQIAFGNSASAITSSPALIYSLSNSLLNINGGLFLGNITGSAYGIQGATLNTVIYNYNSTAIITLSNGLITHSVGESNFLGAIKSNSLTANTISGGTYFSGSTPLQTIISNLAGGGGGTSTLVQPGSNITTGGTSSAPVVSVVSSPSLNGLILSGSAQLAGVTSTGMSATTVSAITLFSGTTNLSTTIISVANAAGDFTRVQGSNFITTGGTANAPTINLAQNFSGATVSGGTLYSGSTNLYNIFATIGSGGSSTAVQPGSNITTGGTQTVPTVSVAASPSLNALTLSGAGQFAGVTSTGLSALTISGGTLYSGSTNLYDIFATSASGEANSGENIGGTSTTVATTAGIFKQKTGVLLEMRMFSAGTNISFITGDTITIQASGSGSATAVQPGLNTYTGGTSSAPTINISAATLVSLSANTITGTTIWGNGSNLTGVAHAFTGQTSISFSGFNGGETSYATTGVTNSNINSASTVMIRVIPSVNHPNVEESMVENLTFTQTDIVDGVSFVINANADGGTWGVYNLVYRIIN